MLPSMCGQITESDFMEHVIVRAMQTADLDFAARCTAAEGWGARLPPNLRILAARSGGCLIAEADGEPVGIAIATSYSAAGFVGK